MRWIWMTQNLFIKCSQVCGIVAAVLILDAAHARPSPEAALSGGYR